MGQGLEALFLNIDTDGSGSLSQEEVITYLKSITDDISEKNVKTIFEGLDTSGDKMVDREEFKVQCNGNVICKIYETVWRATIGVRQF